jgi:hypothetical protein
MRILLSALIIIAFCSCSSIKESGNENPDPENFNNSSKTINELNSVPEQGSLFPGMTIEISLYRNLMPSIDQNVKHDLVANIKLGFTDSLKADYQLLATTLWVVKGKSVWETSLIKNDNPVYLSSEFSAKNGPQWKPNQKVDVIIELKENNSTQLVKIKKITINAAY